VPVDRFGGSPPVLTEATRSSKASQVRVRRLHLQTGSSLRLLAEFAVADRKLLERWHDNGAREFITLCGVPSGRGRMLRPEDGMAFFDALLTARVGPSMTVDEVEAEWERGQ
jgi:hypothetical protein